MISQIQLTFDLIRRQSEKTVVAMLEAGKTPEDAAKLYVELVDLGISNVLEYRKKLKLQ